MALDEVDVVGSDAWWMQRLYQELKSKQPRLDRLESYRLNRQPLAWGSRDLHRTFYQVQQMCRLGVAELAVVALTERLAVRAIHTAASTDEDGDTQATALWNASGMDVAQDDLYRMLCTFGEAVTSVWAPASEGEFSQIVVEDPRQCIVAVDPENPQKRLAAFKLFHDPLAQVDYAILWRPGRKVVAYFPRKAPLRTPVSDFPWLPQVAQPLPSIGFSPKQFILRPEQGDAVDDGLLWSQTYSVLDIPVVAHTAPGAVGVFELHTDNIDRINHIILQGIQIATLQAFKQKAIELPVGTDLPKFDDDGNEINYDDIFTADPGAMWILPVGAKIWESGQVDLTGIGLQTKDAIQQFASNTRTPFSMFSSDSVNQSAEGAQLVREGLVFHAEAIQRVASGGLTAALSIGLQFMPDDVRFTQVGVTRVDRADRSGMSIDWLPAERYSLAEKAQADSLALSLPRRQKLRRIWGLTPAEVDQAMAEAQEDALLAAVAGPQAATAAPEVSRAAAAAAS